MYAVVGCSDCQALWIVEGRPERTQCPRCGSRHKFERLEPFVRTEDRDEAREVRAAVLAAEQGREGSYEDLDSVEEMAAQIDDVGVSDREYLAANGIDSERVAAAAEPDDSGPTGRRERVLAAIDAVEKPTEAAVVDYATDRGIPADRVREVLEKLEREGSVVRGAAGYRRL